MARIARTPQRTDVMLPHPRPRVPRVAVAPRAGELAPHHHLTTLAGRVLMSLLAVTRVMARMTTRIVVSASLLPVTLPATLRAAVGAAVALVAPAAVLPVVLVTLGAALVEAAICLGIRSGKL